MGFKDIDINVFIREANDQEITEEQLGEKYGVDPRTIRNWKKSLREQGVKIKYRQDMKENGVHLRSEIGEEKEDEFISASELLKLLAIYRTKTDVAKALGVSRRIVEKYCQIYNIMSDGERAKAVLDALSVAGKIVRPYKCIRKANKNNTEDLNIAIGDLHAGKEIIRENNKVTFNMKIFNDRIDQYIEDLTSLVKQHIKLGSNIDNVNIIGIGDLVDGTGIFASQPFQQVAGFPDQTILVFNALVKIIKTFLSWGMTVRMYAVPGNHGALDANPENNFDLLVYKMVENWIYQNKVKNVEVNYTVSEYLDVNIRGWKYHLRHKTFKQAATSAGSSKFLGWSRIHDNADVIVCGHFHTPMMSEVCGTRVIMNGSLCGPDEFADKLAVSSEPSQVVWGTSKKRPITFFYVVDLK